MFISRRSLLAIFCILLLMNSTNRKPFLQEYSTRSTPNYKPMVNVARRAPEIIF